MSKNLSWRAWMYPAHLGSDVSTYDTLNGIVYRLMVIRFDDDGQMVGSPEFDTWWMRDFFEGKDGVPGTFNPASGHCRPPRWSWPVNGIVAESQFDADKFARHCLGDKYAGKVG